MKYQQQAEAAFRSGDFGGAARLANHALVEMPSDGKLILFTAQTLFAVGDYRSAAAAIHHATALLDESQWGYVVENYRTFYRGSDFVDQMSRLNTFIEKTPDASYAYFVRGYQHGFLGHQESALRDLNKALELEKRDRLASQLIVRFGGVPPANAAPALNAPALDAAGSALQGDGHAGHNHGANSQNASGDGHNHSHGGASLGVPIPGGVPVPTTPPILEAAPVLPPVVGDDPNEI